MDANTKEVLLALIGGVAVVGCVWAWAWFLVRMR